MKKFDLKYQKQNKIVLKTKIGTLKDKTGQIWTLKPKL